MHILDMGIIDTHIIFYAYVSKLNALKYAKYIKIVICCVISNFAQSQFAVWASKHLRLPIADLNPTVTAISTVAHENERLCRIKEHTLTSMVIAM